MSCKMVQEIEFRLLSGFQEYEKCFELQKEIFKTSDKDTLPPIFLNLLSRENPRVGFALGAFNKENDELVGFFLNVAGVEENSVYCMTLGIKPGFQQKNIGINFFKALRKHAIASGIKHIYGIFEPLEGNLGNFYFSKLGLTGIKYESDVYELQENDFPIDKILLKWDINSSQTNEKIDGTYKKENIENLLDNYPIANHTDELKSNKLLIQIPDDFIRLKQGNRQEALKWRMKTRELFIKYLNEKSYQITDFYSQITDNRRENYYLLEKNTI